MLVYVPLEHIDGRYTVHMDRDIEAYLNAEGLEYVKVMPTTETPSLPEGQFLNAAFTSKSLVRSKMAILYSLVTYGSLVLKVLLT